jgi:hypothetical protein
LKVSAPITTRSPSSIALASVLRRSMRTVAIKGAGRPEFDHCVRAAADDADGDTGADAARLPERGLAAVRIGKLDV